MPDKAIAVIATLDTKGPEAAFVKMRLEAAGYRTLLLDTGILESLDPFPLRPDVGPDDIARAGGADRRELIARSADRDTRNRGIRAMAQGCAKLLLQLHGAGRFRGVLGLGGAQGTEICTQAMRALPLGVPKMMLSTVASGQTPFGIYTGTRDLTIMHSVVDILGLNSLTRRVLANAVGAVVGMAECGLVEQDGLAPRAGMTIYGQTTPAALAIKPRLEASGYEVFTFHCSGTGGRAMEELAGEGLLDLLLDLSTHEITDELFGGIHAGDANRLVFAGLKGVPRLVVPGAVDLITLGEPESVPHAFRSQAFVRHNPHITLVRLTAEQMLRVAEVMAERLNRAVAPVSVLIPRGGFSFYNRDGMHFRDMAADQAFVDRLTSRLRPAIQVREVKDHVNDPAFVEEVLSSFNALARKSDVRRGEKNGRPEA